MSTHIPGHHIDGMVRHFAHLLPEGWTDPVAYRTYLEDADGGRAPYRRTVERDFFISALERDAEDWSDDA